MNQNPYESPQGPACNAPIGRYWSYWIRDTLALLATAIVGLPLVFILAAPALWAIDLVYHWLTGEPPALPPTAR